MCQMKTSFLVLMLNCCCFIFASENKITPNREPSVVISVSRGHYEVYNQELHSETSWRVDFVESIRGVGKEQMESLNNTLISCAFPYLKDYIKKGGLPRPDVAHCNIMDYSGSVVFAPDREKTLEACGSSYNCHTFWSNLRICFASTEYVTWDHSIMDVDMGGSGCQTEKYPRVYSIRKQRFVTEEEFIDMKKFPEVCNLLLAQYLRIDGRLVSDEEAKKEISGVTGRFTVELDGMRWWLPPYTIFCGARGNVEAFLSWKQLRPYLLPGVEEKFCLSEQQKMDLCVRQK